MPYSPSPATTTSTPSNPTGTTSTTAVMMGLAGSLTPQVTGRVLLILSGDISNNTTADGVTVQLSYGTGTAPTNGAALTGTQIGGIVSFTALTGVLTVPFCVTALIIGLSVPSINSLGATTASTAYWLDAAVKAVTAGTASISNLDLVAIEL